MDLGKLKKVNLREAWKDEAHDFTKWLAREENLNLLSEEIGTDIKLIDTEANVGDFNVDILAEEENTGKKIIIENQLEKTDHDHLGKIITYASGHDAKIIIWIFESIKSEHRQAVDWLNEHTDEDVNFFAIKMELWQIDDYSSPAPKFQVISSPNDWAKIIKHTQKKDSLSDTKLLQLDFWDSFREYVNSKESFLRLRKTTPQHRYGISIGSSYAQLYLTINTKRETVGCELYIFKYKKEAEEIYGELLKYKDEIEQKIDGELVWQEGVGVKIYKKVDIANKENWTSCFEWLKNNAEKFEKIFSHYLHEMGKGDKLIAN